MGRGNFVPPLGTHREGNAMNVVRLIKKFPVTVTYIAIQTILGIVSGTLTSTQPTRVLSEWAAGYNETVHNHEWWTVLTGLLIPRDVTEFIIGVVLAVALLGVSEWKMRSGKTVAALLLTGAVAIGLGLGIQTLGILIGDWWAQGSRGELTLDPVIAVCGAFLASTAFMSHLWKRRARIWTLSLLSIFVLFSGDTVDIYRLFAALTGLVLGWLWTKDRVSETTNQLPVARRRRLWAIMVAIAAVGPLLSFIRPNGLAPLGLIGGVFTGQIVTTSQVLEACSQGSQAACVQTLMASTHHGVAATLLTFVPSILLLLSSWGLAKGRRFALWVALIVNLSAAIVGFTALNLWAGFQDLHEPNWPALKVIELIVLSTIGVLVPAALSVGLFLNRSYFPIRAPRQLIKRFTLVIISTTAGLFVLTLAIEILLNNSLDGDLSWRQIFSAVFRPFVPFHLSNQHPHAGALDSALSVVLLGWAPTLAWAVVIVGIAYVISNTEKVPHASHFAAAAELLKFNSGTLGYWKMWQGNEYWLSHDGLAAVAYRVHSGIALALTEPMLSPTKSLDEAVTEFTSFCEEQHWSPAFYSVHAQSLSAFTRLGWSHLEVAQETLISLEQFDLSEKKWQKVRHAANRATRDEIEAKWTTWSQLSPQEQHQISTISGAWASEKKLTEMGFTLGGLEELKTDEVGLMIAVDAHGVFQGVTSWLPVYQDGKVIGRTLDFMRRGPEGFNGVMEFLIGSSALHFKAEGMSVMSLSGVPLSRSAEIQTTNSAAMTSVLGLLARRLEPIYGFASLFFYKQKFNPEFEPLFLTYLDSARLPRIALSIGQAYLPNMSTRHVLTFVRLLLKK